MSDTHDVEPGRPAAGLRRFLLASDLTAYTDRAFDRAVMLAEEHRASIRILHAVDPQLLPERYLRRDIREAQAQLEHELRESGADARLDVSVKVASGDADRLVVEEALAMQADLVVMGLSHAALIGTFRGTTVDKVVRRAHCPVLVVKTRPRRGYASVAVAVDLAEPSRRVVDLALRLFPAGQLTVMHVDETAPAGRGVDAGDRRHRIEEMVAACCAAAGREGPGSANGPRLLVTGGRAADVLKEQLARLRPDLVAVGTHGRTGVSGLLVGSVAETLLELLPYDMLVTRG